MTLPKWKIKKKSERGFDARYYNVDLCIYEFLEIHAFLFYFIVKHVLVLKSYLILRAYDISTFLLFCYLNGIIIINK